MRVVIPVLGFSKSGGERVLSKLATELSRSGHDTFFVVPEDKSIPYYETEATIIRSPQVKKYSKIINFIASYYCIWKACRQLKPDVAIANFHLTAYLVLFLGFNLKKIYYIQAYEVVFGSNIIQKFMAYVTYFLPLIKVVNNEKLLPTYINNYSAVVSAGLDLELFTPRVFRLNRELLTIGIVGRKEQHKGTSEVIDTIIQWSAKCQIHLNIAVYLSDSNRLKLQENRISYEYTAIYSDQDLAKFYRTNDLMIATGLVEDGAFHYPCAESMASGCLVISNYAPLTTTKSYLKLDTFSKEALLLKLDLVLQLPESDLHNEVQDNIKEVAKISWNEIGKQFNAVLTKTPFKKQMR